MSGLGMQRGEKKKALNNVRRTKNRISQRSNGEEEPRGAALRGLSLSRKGRSGVRSRPQEGGRGVIKVSSELSLISPGRNRLSKQEGKGNKAYGPKAGPRQRRSLKSAMKAVGEEATVMVSSRGGKEYHPSTRKSTNTDALCTSTRTEGLPAFRQDLQRRKPRGSL